MTSGPRVHGDAGEGAVIILSLDFHFVVTAHSAMGRACEQKQCVSESLEQVLATESPLQPTPGILM